MADLLRQPRGNGNEIAMISNQLVNSHTQVELSLLFPVTRIAYDFTIATASGIRYP